MQFCIFLTHGKIVKQVDFCTVFRMVFSAYAWFIVLVILAMFLDNAKTARPHGSGTWQTEQNVCQKHGKIRRENEEEKGRDFGQVLGRFWEAFGTILAVEMC